MDGIRQVHPVTRRTLRLINQPSAAGARGTGKPALDMLVPFALARARAHVAAPTAPRRPPR